ncbi:MAG: glycoside hydrolase family 13 protein [Ilumatobacteraceae bacterium]
MARAVARSTSADDEQRDWWRDAVVYQIYPRSFADSGADGIGDLRGICARLSHLIDLGVDAIWLSPFYPSPLVDGGYDVADHRDVDPRLGTLADFDELVGDAHANGIKVLIDVVANHTSDRHPWFVEALHAGPGSAARARFIFRDGSGADGALQPSDWRSHFGGSAWQRVPDGQWYCHLFAPEQPDLDWDHPEVRTYFLDTLRFWADRGVDGFRVDMAHTLVKDLAEPLRSQTHLDHLLPLDGSDPLYDRDGVHVVYEGWRQVFDEYDPPRMAVAETWDPANRRTELYARPTELGQVFDFALQKCSWDYAEITASIRASLEQHRLDDAPTWVLSSHDTVRHASRLALPAGVRPDAWVLSGGLDPPIDAEVGRRRARAATLMMLALPGSAYLYQGEELGLPEVADLPAACLQDPTWERSGRTVKGRDGCRVPLPWTRGGSSLGFGAGGAWLPQPPWFAAVSVEAQQGVTASCLEMYRHALALRRELRAVDAEVEWPDGDAASDGVLHYRRSNGWACIVNFAAAAVPLPDGPLLISSSPSDGRMLAVDTAAWVGRP